MSSLEVIDLVTYVCAALGGILLLLCIILATILIYLQCRQVINVVVYEMTILKTIKIDFFFRKHFFPGSARYVVVPAENEANIENGYVKQKTLKTPNSKLLYFIKCTLYCTKHLK